MAKILLANKFYYPRGGDCIAVLSLERLLKSKGHEVAVFSTQNENNLDSEWGAFFPEAVSFSGSFSQKIKAARRLFRPKDVAASFRRLLDGFKPDVVHLHNVHSYLSPVVAEIAHSRGLRVVWTLHDYKLLCPSYACLRDNQPCELCFKRKLNVLKHKCMKGSTAASLMAWLEAKYWNREKIENITDTFISPSLFLKGKMAAGGFNPDKIEVLNNFMHKQAPAATAKEDYYCYAGRLSAEKGIETLLDAAKDLPFRLKVIGDGPLDASKYSRQGNIQFLGRMGHSDLFEIVSKARFSVIPSICYDNSPYSAIESLCMGTPVLGARTGGIPELITSENGMLFAPGDTGELSQKIQACFNNKTYDYKKIATDANNKFSPGAFYNKLMKIYNIKP